MPSRSCPICRIPMSRPVLALVGLAAILILALGPSVAAAIAPGATANDLAIPRPGIGGPIVWRSEPLDPILHPAAAGFAREAGKGWTVQWDSRTGVPHAIFGSSVALTAGPLDSPREVERVVRAFAASHAFLLGSGDELRLTSLVSALGKWGVIFEQVRGGIPVIGGRLRFLLTHDGRLTYVSSEMHPGIRLDLRPIIDAREAAVRAGRAIGYTGNGADAPPELAILPIAASNPDRYDYRLVWRVRQRIDDPFAVWISYVDAHDGTVLWRKDEVCRLDVIGRVDGNVEDPGWCAGEKDRPMAHIRVRIQASGDSAATDAGGTFTIPHAGVDPVTIRCNLRGPWIDVDNEAAPGDGTLTGVATPGQPCEIRWTDAAATDAERDVFLHGNRIHDMIKRYDPDFAAPDVQMTALVNVSGTCGAWCEPSQSLMAFLGAGNGCANAGQMGDIVYHEYTHALDYWIYHDNPLDVSEGNSDVAADMIDGDSIVGEGFFLDCSSGIRNAENTNRWPDDYQENNPYWNALIISGFWWDTWQALLPQYGEGGTRDILWPLWHFSRRLLQPIEFPDQVLAAFLTDDDNGNLHDGTPHHDALCAGALNHGFECPEVMQFEIVHAPLDPTDQANVDRRVEAGFEMYLGNVLDPAGVWFAWRLEGGEWNQVPMLQQDSVWVGTIPGEPRLSVVDYYIHAADQAGHERTAPEAGASDPYHYEIASYVQTFEGSDGGWTQSHTSPTGWWTWCDPVPTIAQPGDDHTSAGTRCWVTGNNHPNGDPWTDEVGAGMVTLVSPAFDLAGATRAEARWWWWYSDDLGGNPNQDPWDVSVQNNGGVWLPVYETRLATNEWREGSVDLKALLGASIGSVRLRFMASDDAYRPSLNEAALDDFMLLTQDAADAADRDGVGWASALRSVGPNPTGGAGWVVVRYEIAAAAAGAVLDRAARARSEGTADASATSAAVRLAVYDAAGRLVRTLVDGGDGISGAGAEARGESVAPGPHSVTWDGRDNAGRRVASGVYFVRLTAGGVRDSRAVVVSR